MRYWISLAFGLITAGLGIALGMAMFIRLMVGAHGGGHGAHGAFGIMFPGFGVILLLVVAAVLLLISIRGLRKEKESKRFVHNTDLDIEQPD